MSGDDVGAYACARVGYHRGLDRLRRGSYEGCEEILAAMDDWNKKHHGGSGLVDRVKASTISEADAEAQTIAFIKDFAPDYSTFTTATAPLTAGVFSLSLGDVAIGVAHSERELDDRERLRRTVCAHQHTVAAGAGRAGRSRTSRLSSWRTTVFVGRSSR